MSNRRFPYTKYVSLEANAKDWRKITIYKGQMKHGKIVTLGLWFPKGCGNLVRVRFDIDGEKIPALNGHSDDYYVGDDVRFPILINKDISMNTEVTLEYMNLSSDAQSIGITWEIEPVKEEKKQHISKHKEKPEKKEEERKEGKKETAKMPEPKITVERKLKKQESSTPKKAVKPKTIPKPPEVIKKRAAQKPIVKKQAKKSKGKDTMEGDTVLLEEIFEDL